MIDLRTIPALPFTRAQFLSAAVRLAMLNIPYLWGGKDPVRGLDCSGFVTSLVWRLSNGKVDIRATHNTTALLEQLEIPIGEARPGDLAFYGPNGRTNHVMVCLGEGVVLGQGIGDASCTDAELSRRDGKTTKVFTMQYRPDLIGVRRFRFSP